MTADDSEGKKLYVEVDWLPQLVHVLPLNDRSSSLI